MKPSKIAIGDSMHEEKHTTHVHKPGHGPGYKGIGDVERRKMMDPDAILPKAGLGPGMTFVDVGCGQGFFAIPAAQIVGKKGRVYGIDIDEEALRVLSHRASESGLDISIIQGNAENTIACEGCADIVFFGISLHDFGEPKKVLENAWRMLKPGGILADLDGKKLPGESPYVKKLGEKEAATLLGEANFSIASIEDISELFYHLLAKK